MSRIYWQGDQLMQNVGDDTAPLGHVELDPQTNTYVLWLADHHDLFGFGGNSYRGDEFSTMKEAKQKAATCPVSRLMHHIWMVRVGKDKRQLS